MGFRSGDWLGHSRTFNMFLFEPLLCCLGRMFWFIVMLEDSSMTHFQCSHWGKEIVCQNFPAHGSIHPPLDTVKSSLAEKHPQSIRFPPPCFTVGMVFLGLYSAFLFLQTRRVELMPNSSILVSSDHITFSQASSGSSRCSLANFRWACTCAFFSRGTLRAQQDFNPSRCSVLLMVLFVTVVPTAFRSLTSSYCVVLGWSLTFLIIIDIPRGEILCGAPDRGRWRWLCVSSIFK